MINTAGLSRINKKEENQDSYSIIKYSVGELEIMSLAIADGISKGDRGRWYADTAVQSFQGRLAAFLSMNTDTETDELTARLEKFMEGILEEVNNDVLEQVIRQGFGQGGATLSAVLIVGENMVLTANAGDSPIFVIRKNGDIEFLYTSGKMVDVMVRHGEMAYGSEEYYRQSNRLSVYMGAPEISEQYSHKYTLQNGDRLIMGSDGAFDGVDEDALRSILTTTSVSQRICAELMDLASSRGAYDNQTLIVCGYITVEEVSNRKSIFGKGSRR